MTKITIENEFGTYSVSTNANVDFLKCFIERLVKPCLCAMGYSQNLVDDVVNLSDDEAMECYNE